MSKTEYFVFHKEWYELKKELSAKAWIELEDYMLQLRFDGIDTDPKSIKNKTVRLQWIMIRKKIYDSINNMNRQKKHRDQIANENNPSNVIEPNDDFKVEENNIPCNVEQQEEHINNSNNPKPEEDMGNPTNIIIKDGKTLVVNEPAVEYRNNSTPTLSDRIQHLINNDDNFYKVFTNCTKRIAHYRINNTDICASNSIEMAYDKLERMFDEYHIPFNTEANEFIENDINDIIKAKTIP